MEQHRPALYSIPVFRGRGYVMFNLEYVGKAVMEKYCLDVKHRIYSSPHTVLHVIIILYYNNATHSHAINFYLKTSHRSTAFVSRISIFLYPY